MGSGMARISALCLISSSLSSYIIYGNALNAGSRRVAGLDLQGEQIHIINHGDIWGKCCELGFKLIGFAPDFVNRLLALNPVLVHPHYGPNGRRALQLAGNLNLDRVEILVREKWESFISQLLDGTC
jgi:hypothetical protein